MKSANSQNAPSPAYQQKHTTLKDPFDRSPPLPEGKSKCRDTCEPLSRVAPYCYFKALLRHRQTVWHPENVRCQADSGR